MSECLKKQPNNDNFIIEVEPSTVTILFFNYVHDITLCTINIHYFTKRKRSFDMFFSHYNFLTQPRKKNSKYKLQQVALFEGLQVVLRMSKNTSLKASEEAGGADKEQTTCYLFKTRKNDLAFITNRNMITLFKKILNKQLFNQISFKSLPQTIMANTSDPIHIKTHHPSFTKPAFSLIYIFSIFSHQSFTKLEYDKKHCIKNIMPIVQINSDLVSFQIDHKNYVRTTTHTQILITIIIMIIIITQFHQWRLSNFILNYCFVIICLLFGRLMLMV